MCDYGAKLVVSTVEPGNDDVIAILGMSAPSLRASLVLRTSPAFLQNTYPVGAVCAGDALFDWCGELVNQLGGRFKRRLFELGVALAVSTPMAVTGRDLRLVPARSSNARWLSFSGPTGDVWVLLDTLATMDFDLQHEPAATAYLAEGECLFF
jgi:hypothetical protein